MIIEEVEVSPGEAVNLGERSVHLLEVERPAPFEEGILVAEVAVVGTAAGHGDGVGDQVQLSPDQIAANLGETLQSPRPGDVDGLGSAAPQVLEESREGVFGGTQEDRVGVPSGLLGLARDV